MNGVNGAKKGPSTPKHFVGGSSSWKRKGLAAVPSGLLDCAHPRANPDKSVALGDAYCTRAMPLRTFWISCKVQAEKPSRMLALRTASGSTP